jgi:hypothetical protein
MARKPCVAGQFYPEDPGELRAVVESFIAKREKIRGARGLLSPHAGYAYSGRVAGYAYSAVDFPDIIAVVGPNHTGYGKPVGVSTEDFITPLGTVRCYREGADSIGKDFSVDNVSHIFEHSVEVQLPFLQVVKGDFQLIAITMMDQSYDTAMSLGRSLDKHLPDSAIVIASSDMCHYVPLDVAERKDGLAIERIQEMDTKGLYDTVIDNDITMCGYGCAIAMMCFSLLRGADRAELLKHGTSADAQPMRDVVGYCSMVTH